MNITKLTRFSIITVAAIAIVLAIGYVPEEEAQVDSTFRQCGDQIALIDHGNFIRIEAEEDRVHWSTSTGKTYTCLFNRAGTLTDFYAEKNNGLQYSY